MPKDETRHPHSFLHCCQQESTGLLPLASHRTLGPTREFRDLPFVVTGEVTHLHNLGQRWIKRLECRQGIVNRYQRSVALGGRQAAGKYSIEAQHRSAASTSLGELFAREVDDDIAHSLRSVSEEVLPVGEHQRGGIH